MNYQSYNWTEPEGNGRGRVPRARALLLCIDTSGSMDSQARVQGSDDDDITSLQLVGHACRTVLQAVFQHAPQSQVAVYTFGRTVGKIDAAACLDTAQTKYLSDKIDALIPEGCTNMWGAIEQTIGDARALIAKDIAVDIFLLTDGQPTENTNPRAGIAKALADIMPPAQHCCIHTFGFGPAIDSALLLEIAGIGHGIFKYISDAGMVGTVMINSICKFIHDQSPTAA